MSNPADDWLRDPKVTLVQAYVRWHNLNPADVTVLEGRRLYALLVHQTDGYRLHRWDSSYMDLWVDGHGWAGVEVSDETLTYRRLCFTAIGEPTWGEPCSNLLELANKFTSQTPYSPTATIPVEWRKTCVRALVDLWCRTETVAGTSREAQGLLLGQGLNGTAFEYLLTDDGSWRP